MSEPMVTHFADDNTLRRLKELEAEIDRLRAQESEIAAALWPDKRDGDTWSSAFFVQEIDRLRAENATERKRAEFWKGETAKRVAILRKVHANSPYECPMCGRYNGKHLPECDLARLMTMPEEPKP